MTTAIEVVTRWESRERPLFKGCLIDADGCCCAQGDVLRHAGKSDAELWAMNQAVADRECAALLGISRAHAVLLRDINDKADGAPQSTLKASGLLKILGPTWRLQLAFWRHMDAMTDTDWKAVATEASGPYAALAAAWDAARDAVRDAVLAVARDAAWDAARDAVRAAVLAVARDAVLAVARDAVRAAVLAVARDAARELVVIDVLKSPPYFLRFFFHDPAAWIEAHKNDRDPGIIED